MQSSNIYRGPSRPVRPKYPRDCARKPRDVCEASGAPATACTRLLTFRAAGFLYPFCLHCLGEGMQTQTAPVAFTTARVPNGPLQNVYEQHGYRWTEGGNRARHFRRSDCDIVEGRKAIHFVPQRCGAGHAAVDDPPPTPSPRQIAAMRRTQNIYAKHTLTPRSAAARAAPAPEEVAPERRAPRLPPPPPAPRPLWLF